MAKALNFMSKYRLMRASANSAEAFEELVHASLADLGGFRVGDLNYHPLHWLIPTATQRSAVPRGLAHNTDFIAPDAGERWWIKTEGGYVHFIRNPVDETACPGVNAVIPAKTRFAYRFASMQGIELLPNGRYLGLAEIAIANYQNTHFREFVGRSLFGARTHVNNDFAQSYQRHGNYGTYYDMPLFHRRDWAFACLVPLHAWHRWIRVGGRGITTRLAWFVNFLEAVVNDARKAGPVPSNSRVYFTTSANERTIPPFGDTLRRTAVNMEFCAYLSQVHTQVRVLNERMDVLRAETNTATSIHEISSGYVPESMYFDEALAAAIANGIITDRSYFSRNELHLHFPGFRATLGFHAPYKAGVYEFPPGWAIMPWPPTSDIQSARAVRLHDNTERRGYPHPHVSADGTFCLGDTVQDRILNGTALRVSQYAGPATFVRTLQAYLLQWQTGYLPMHFFGTLVEENKSDEPPIHITSAATMLNTDVPLVEPAVIGNAQIDDVVDPDNEEGDDDELDDDGEYDEYNGDGSDGPDE